MIIKSLTVDKENKQNTSKKQLHNHQIKMLYQEEDYQQSSVIYPFISLAKSTCFVTKSIDLQKCLQINLLSLDSNQKNSEKMDIEESLSSLFFEQEESHNNFFRNRCSQNDKTTPFITNYHQKNYHHQFLQLPPFQPSYFQFTPASPKNTQNDILMQLAKSSATSGICQKVNFKKDEQMQEYELLQEQQQLQVKKTAPKSCKRNTKSLKNLSQSVYLIMTTMGRARYKQVAQRLIADIINKGQQFNKEKDGNTLKRRVCDALNVLVAAGMLQKKGREFSCSYVLPQRRESKHDYKNQKQIEEKRKIEVDLHKKYEEIEFKRRLVEQLKEKKQKISSIIHRNQRQHPKEQKILNFPLIGTFIEGQKIQLIEYLQNHIMFRLGYRPALYGDVDLMLRIIGQPAVKLPTQVENIYNVLSKVDELQCEMYREKKECVAQMGECVNLQVGFQS